MSASPDIEAIRRAVVEVVGDDPDVVAAYLFGSRATGREKPGSDVDVALLMREGFDYLENYDHIPGHGGTRGPPRHPRGRGVPEPGRPGAPARGAEEGPASLGARP